MTAHRLETVGRSFLIVVDLFEDRPCNGNDCRQWRKQGVAVGAAASRMRGPHQGPKQTLGAATRICRMNLMETLTLFMVLFGLLNLIVEIVCLTVEVMDKVYQKKHDDNKKD